VIEERSDIDLLFTDIGLQQDSEAGLQLARDVAARRPGLPVLYTTGQGVTDGTRAMFAEPFGFVPKPYTPDDLKTVLSNLLSQGSAASGRVNGTGSADATGRRKAGGWPGEGGLSMRSAHGESSNQTGSRRPA
jgi:DNA-binding NtrC family response regulator